MLKINLLGHEYRYEVFQIVSLFYNKSDFEFVDEATNSSLVSGFDINEGIVHCKIDNICEKPIFFSEKIIGNDKKDIKNSIKRTVLLCLEQYTNIELPWGILVGIRPTKLVHDYRMSGLSDQKILDKLMKYYLVSDLKSRLAVEVASSEERFISKSSKDIGFYVGIPFCPTRCSYCSFTSNPINAKNSRVDEYLDALCYESEETLKYLVQSGFNIRTLYFGGGTPTSLSAIQLKRLITTILKYINPANLEEFTVEAGRADSITDEKLRFIKESGCSRISINPQTMNDDTLRRIGRQHSAQDVIDKMNLAREIGFDNINMDFIIGLPGEGLKEIENTINYIKKLSPDNITIHTMAIKRASRLNEAEYKNSSNEIVTMYNRLSDTARELGMYPYYMYRQKNMVSPLENIGYCQKGKEGIYNIQMIAENIPIAAVGADAVSKAVFHNENRIERAANLKDINEYISRIDELIERKKNLFCELAKTF